MRGLRFFVDLFSCLWCVVFGAQERAYGSDWLGTFFTLVGVAFFVLSLVQLEAWKKEQGRARSGG